MLPVFLQNRTPLVFPPFLNPADKGSKFLSKTGLHRIISKKSAVIKVRAIRTSNLTISENSFHLGDSGHSPAGAFGILLWVQEVKVSSPATVSPQGWVLQGVLLKGLNEFNFF